MFVSTAEKSEEVIVDNENHGEMTNSGHTLSTAARGKIIKDLAERYIGWIFIPIMFISTGLFNELFGKSSWNLLWAIIIAGATASQWISHEKKKLQTKDDQVLKLIHDEYREKKVFYRTIGGVIFLVAAGLGIAAFLKGFSMAHKNCSVDSIEITRDTFFIDGDYDAGFIVKFNVKNFGNTGLINSKVRLSTSEGDFERATQRLINSGESQILRVDFPEPTINAKDIQAIATCER